MAGTTDKRDPETINSEAPLVQSGRVDYFAVDVGLRVLLFAATVTALVLTVTSKQTELVPVPGLLVLVPLEAKFTDSPAFIYAVAALSVACLYSIITTVTSLGVLAKPTHATKILLHYAICDLLMLGIMASQTGAAGGVAYIGLKGNKHVGWMKICNVYDKFCRHVGASIAVSLFASVILVLLVLLSVLSLYSRIRK
ncbi:CASP-like protein 1D1 [Euphorbia lathyris]|uniref:CASP-like protein 1D1 n=1 Tax=Euphorbia lathyris TaxID=212925 RepID=UPI00331386AA